MNLTEKDVRSIAWGRQYKLKYRRLYSFLVVAGIVFVLGAFVLFIFMPLEPGEFWRVSLLGIVGFACIIGSAQFSRQYTSKAVDRFIKFYRRHNALLPENDKGITELPKEDTDDKPVESSQ